MCAPTYALCTSSEATAARPTVSAAPILHIAHECMPHALAYNFVQWHQWCYARGLHRYAQASCAGAHSEQCTLMIGICLAHTSTMVKIQ